MQMCQFWVRLVNSHQAGPAVAVVRFRKRATTPTTDKMEHGGLTWARLGHNQVLRPGLPLSSQRLDLSQGSLLSQWRSRTFYALCFLSTARATNG